MAFTTAQAGGQIQPTANIPAAYEGDALELARAQRLAQMLGSQPMPEGQMVSGRFVKPSWTQQLAGLVNAGTGAYYANKAENEQQALAKKIREGETSALADYMATKQGRPAVPDQFTELAGPYGRRVGKDGENVSMPIAAMAGTPAIQANPQAAYANLYTDPRASTKLRDMAFTKMNEGPMKVGVEDVLLDPNTLKPVYTGAGKQPDVIKYAIAVGQLPSDPKTWNPQQAAYAKTLVESKASAGADKSNQKDFSNSLSLRKEFNNEPVYKGHQEIKSAWNTINVGLKQANPAGDLAAATKFMKLLDPTSVVRESELLLAMKATGALDRLYNYAQMRANGTLLTPKQRGEFGTLANEFYQTATNQYNSKYNEYSDIAKRNNLNPLDIGKPEASVHSSQWGEVQEVKK
jgi:hypothetical protein